QPARGKRIGRQRQSETEHRHQERLKEDCLGISHGSVPAPAYFGAAAGVGGLTTTGRIASSGPKVGTCKTGYLGSAVFAVSSRRGRTWKFAGISMWMVKYFPGCVSTTSTLTPSPLTETSDSFTGALPRFWMTAECR